MRALTPLLLCTVSLVSAVSLVEAATITGTVKGPDGKPFMAAFVVAENAQNKMTYNVLSDAQGRYYAGNLPAATYNVRIRAIGYKSDPHTGIQLSADQKSSFDFTLQTSPVRWSDLNTFQGTQLLPKTKAHDLTKRYQDNFFTSCLISCHSFQSQMADKTWTEEGLRNAVKYMRDVIIGGEGGNMTDDKFEDIVAYMSALWGPNAAKPQYPDQLPEYKSTVRSFNPRAMNIAYVEYEFPHSKGLGPWSAVEDKNGMMWIPYYGRGNEVVRLNPKTAEMTRFPLPFAKTAGIHSAVPAPDGSVWFTEAAMGKVGRLDPATKKFDEYQNTPLPNGRRTGTHTVRVDDKGRIWTSGGPTISMFDPLTKEFSHFDVPATYGNVVGQNGDEWFTSFRDDGPIARVTKDGVLSKFNPPMPQFHMTRQDAEAVLAYLKSLR